MSAQGCPPPGEEYRELSWTANQARSASCQHSHSHSYSRKWPRGRHLRFPGPIWLKKKVTFQDQGNETSSKEDPSRELLGQATSRELEEHDLGLPPTLELDLKSFLEVPRFTWGPGDRSHLLPEPSIENYDIQLE